MWRQIKNIITVYYMQLFIYVLSYSCIFKVLPQRNLRQKVLFFFKIDQWQISEQCKWVLPIHSAVICHKSQGLHEHFEMLIRLRVVTSLCTFKNTTDLSFMCAWKLWRLPLSLSPIVKMSKLNMKFRLAMTASKVRTFFSSPKDQKGCANPTTLPWVFLCWIHHF